MKSAKEEVREILEKMPDGASLEDIQYQIYVRQKIDRGIQDVKDGKTNSQQESAGASCQSSGRLISGK